MDLEIAKKLISEMSAARNKPMYSIFGGEPLTYPYLEELFQAIKEEGNVIDIATNGTLLTKYAPMLVRLGVDQIKVSIDGPKEVNDLQRGQGSYEKALEGIKSLHEEKIKVGKTLP